MSDSIFNHRLGNHIYPKDFFPLAHLKIYLIKTNILQYCFAYLFARIIVVTQQLVSERTVEHIYLLDNRV